MSYQLDFVHFTNATISCGARHPQMPYLVATFASGDANSSNGQSPHQVKLKLRLDDLQAPSVPKRCSSCFGRPARERRTLTAQYQLKRGHAIRWTIQLPLCQECNEMAEVITSYRPSKHGPAERAQGNRWAASALLVVSVAALAALIVPQSAVTELTGLTSPAMFTILAMLFVGLYLWNYRANQYARLAMYEDLVDQAGHPFGGVTVEKGKRGPILVFDNEEFGRAFEESNQDHLVKDEEMEDDLDTETRTERLVRLLRAAFRLRSPLVIDRDETTW